MVYEYKFMVYEYPFADKFGCCSLYDREGAEETKANTKQIFYTIIQPFLFDYQLRINT